MECFAAEKAVSDYLSGELAAPQALELENHLRECAACRALLDEYQRLLTACRSLPPFEARDDLWQGLRQRLPRLREESAAEESLSPVVERLHRQVLFYQRLAVAIAAAGVLSISLWLWRFAYPGAGSFVEPEGGETARLAELEIQRAEMHYQKAIQSLSEALDAAKGEWSGEVKTVVEKNLAAIDQSIDECRKMLRLDPRNVEVGSYLLAAYRKKVDFMRSLIDQMGSSS